MESTSKAYGDKLSGKAKSASASGSGSAPAAGTGASAGAAQAADSELARRDREVFARGSLNVHDRARAKLLVHGSKIPAFLLVALVLSFLYGHTPMSNSLRYGLLAVAAVALVLVGTEKHTLFPRAWRAYYALLDQWSELAQEWASHEPGRKVDQFPSAYEQFSELVKQARSMFH